jgi:hypothetical protein
MPILHKYSARTIPGSAQRLHLELMRRMPQAAYSTFSSTSST